MATSNKESSKVKSAPREGGTTRRVWDILDKISSTGKSRKEMLVEVIGAGINHATAATQYGAWRTYQQSLGKWDAIQKRMDAAKEEAKKENDKVKAAAKPLAKKVPAKKKVVAKKAEVKKKAAPKKAPAPKK